MSLYVDIEKKCGDFQLKVKFEAGEEVFAMLGASGCGKSMTLKCIAGIEKPDRGVIRLGDRVLFDSAKKINVPARKRKVGYLFQDYALFPNMTVLQNILCGAGDGEKAMEYVRKFYLEGKEDLYPAQLSGGQKQRVAMARMLSAEPELILLDEPFSALDNYLKTQLERQVMDMLDSFGKTVLFVSHDRNEVYRMTDWIAVMENGEIVSLEHKKELFQNPKTLAATLLTGCKNITDIEMHEKDGRQILWAKDWGVSLGEIPRRRPHEMPVGMPVEMPHEMPVEKKPSKIIPRYGAFRAHYFQVVEEKGENFVLECDIIRVVEDTFSVCVLFRNKGCEEKGDNSVLTYELPKEDWEKIKDGPIYLKIPAEKIIFLDR